MKPNPSTALESSCNKKNRTYKVQVAYLLGTLLLSSLIYGCLKEDTPLALKSTTTATDDHKQTLDFIAKAKELKQYGSISLRTETYYNTADAIALLNDALNLNYCTPSTDYATMKVHKDSTNLMVTASHTISETNLLSLYNNMAATSGSHFYADSDNTKEPFAFEVSQANNLNGNALPLYVTFFMTKGTCPAPSSYPYGEEDDWKWGYDEGKCNNPTDPYDAADLLRCDLRKNKLYKKTNKHESYYFSNRFSVCFSRWEATYCAGNEIDYQSVMPDLSIKTEGLINLNDATTNDNFYDYYVYKSDDNLPNPHLCLTDSEMNFYYEKMADLCTNFNPLNKVIGNIEVGYQILDGNYLHYFHSMRVDYWKKNVAIGDPWIKTSLPCLDPPC